jgi:hypothetical protein
MVKHIKTIVVTNPEVISKLEKLVKSQQDFKEYCKNINPENLIEKEKFI